MWTVLVFGCGSLGANTTLNLARRWGSDIQFILVDYDRIEDVNLANQPWVDTLVGQTKVIALSHLVYRLTKGRCFPINYKVEDSVFLDILKSRIPEETVKRLDVCIDCFDNILSRKLTHSIAKELGVPVLHAGFTETSYLCTWKDIFDSETGSREPVCDRRELSTVVQLGAAITEYVISQYLSRKEKSQYFLDNHENITILSSKV